MHGLVAQLVTRPNVPAFGTGGERFIITMYTNYVLKDKDGKLYKGMTNNLNRRLLEHARGKTKTTRNMKNLELAYKEEYNSFEVARKREIYFKTAAGRNFLKKILK